MRKLGPALSTLTILGAFGAGLMGCPVWSSDDGSGGGRVYAEPDAGVVTPQSCSSNADCPEGYCSAATHQCVSSASCTSSSTCPAHYYCDSRDVCVPGGCGTDADCTTVASGLTCNTTTHQCAPSGGCTTNAQCTGGQVCLGGSCQAPANQCQFDYQCIGSGQQCVDGRCVVGCTAANAARVCASGQVCTNGFCVYPTAGSCSTACPTGQLCVAGACLRTCSTDATCGAGFMCDHGVCRVDTRPHPFCSHDSDCATNSVCYNGACRRTCPTPSVGTDGGCMTVDVQFDVCRAPDTMGRRLCATSSEVSPQCGDAALPPCTAGHMCVNARCQ